MNGVAKLDICLTACSYTYTGVFRFYILNPDWSYSIPGSRINSKEKFQEKSYVTKQKKIFELQILITWLISDETKEHYF